MSRSRSRGDWFDLEDRVDQPDVAADRCSAEPALTDAATSVLSIAIRCPIWPRWSRPSIVVTPRLRWAAWFRALDRWRWLRSSKTAGNRDSRWWWFPTWRRSTISLPGWNSSRPVSEWDGFPGDLCAPYQGAEPPLASRLELVRLLRRVADGEVQVVVVPVRALLGALPLPEAVAAQVERLAPGETLDQRLWRTG